MSDEQSIIAPDDPGSASLHEMLEAKVAKVFDGDGFLASVWNPVQSKWVHRVPCRFAFIDAPELAQPAGPEARAFLNSLIGRKALRLDLIGKESNGAVPIDDFRRVLCMGYLTEEMKVGEIRYLLNGACNAGTVQRARTVVRNIELEMIVNGWAWVVRQYAFDREDEYFAAQADAQRARRGLWGASNPEAPWKFKQSQKLRRQAAEGQSRLFD